MPSQSPTLNGGGWGIIFDSRYRFLAVSLKKCLSGDNYRRPSQLLLTRTVAAAELYNNNNNNNNDDNGLI